MNYREAKIDSHGFIDSSSFAKDIHSALDEDKKYKETDYMKKRAVKVAQSYDEFKGMVACAHLHTVSRKEVEELSEKKKGWKKSHTTFKGSSLLDDPDTRRGTVNLVATHTLPKTMMEFGRDWRRLEGLESKIPYLVRLGTSKFKKMISCADDFELLEDIQATLVQINEESKNNIDNSRGDGGGLDASKWLKAMTTSKQYDMLMGCVRKELKTSVEAILLQREVNKAAEKACTAAEAEVEAETKDTEPTTVFQSVVGKTEKKCIVPVPYDMSDQLD